VDISIEHKGEVLVCKISGEITFSTSPDLRKQLIEAIDKGAKKWSST